MFLKVNMSLKYCYLKYHSTVDIFTVALAFCLFVEFNIITNKTYVPCLGQNMDLKTDMTAPFIQSDLQKNKLLLVLWPVSLIELQCFHYKNLF